MPSVQLCDAPIFLAGAQVHRMVVMVLSDARVATHAKLFEEAACWYRLARRRPTRIAPSKMRDKLDEVAKNARRQLVQRRRVAKRGFEPVRGLHANRTILAEDVGRWNGRLD